VITGPACSGGGHGPVGFGRAGPPAGVQRLAIQIAPFCALTPAPLKLTRKASKPLRGSLRGEGGGGGAGRMTKGQGARGKGHSKKNRRAPTCVVRLINSRGTN
jgi:hypothetical protein